MVGIKTVVSLLIVAVTVGAIGYGVGWFVTSPEPITVTTTTVSTITVTESTVTSSTRNSPAENDAAETVLPVFDQLDASTVDGGIEFTVRLNSTLLESGQAVAGNYTIINLQPTAANVSMEPRWTIPTLDPRKSRGCPTWVSIQVFPEYYTESNVSSAIPLQIWKPLSIVTCPALEILSSGEYVYSSNNTMYLVLQPHGKEFSGLGEISGYYTKRSNEDGQPQHYDLVPFNR